jgi:hypothetical protein
MIIDRKRRGCLGIEGGLLGNPRRFGGIKQ